MSLWNINRSSNLVGCLWLIGTTWTLWSIGWDRVVCCSRSGDFNLLMGGLGRSGPRGVPLFRRRWSSFTANDLKSTELTQISTNTIQMALFHINFNTKIMKIRSKISREQAKRTIFHASEQNEWFFTSERTIFHERTNDFSRTNDWALIIFQPKKCCLVWPRNCCKCKWDLLWTLRAVCTGREICENRPRNVGKVFKNSNLNLLN